MRELIPVNRYKELLAQEAKKANARGRLRRAVKKGRLTRLPCQNCGDANTKTEGHHEDYDKPMEVIWLCKKCHTKRHAGVRPKGKSVKQGVYYYYKTDESEEAIPCRDTSSTPKANQG